MEKHLRRRSLLLEDDGADSGAEGDADPERATSPRPPSRARRRPPGRSGCVGLSLSNPRARVRQAALRLARWVHVARHARGRARPGGARGALALRAASAGRAGARGSSPWRVGAHHAEEGVCRRASPRRRSAPADTARGRSFCRARFAVDVLACPRW